MIILFAEVIINKQDQSPLLKGPYINMYVSKLAFNKLSSEH